MGRSTWLVHVGVALAALGASAARPSAVAAAQVTPSGVMSDGTRASTASAIAAWIHVDAPPGGESFGQRVLSPILPGWRGDAFGNLIKRIGSGSPRRVVACAMDVPGFVVSQITDDGFVRLHRAGVPGHPLWDQFHEAQQVRVLTARRCGPMRAMPRARRPVRARAVRPWRVRRNPLVPTGETISCYPRSAASAGSD
ncbi:MAG: hypothetical protein IPP90_13275 [Gemmatimonadaceae bacterium]|nr:hypothetical protein [Gemmatimonadaceae bacterium]